MLVIYLIVELESSEQQFKWLLITFNNCICNKITFLNYYFKMTLIIINK